MKKIIKIAIAICFLMIYATAMASEITEERIFDLSTVFNNHIYDYKTAYKHNTYGEDVLGNGMPHDRAASGYWGRNLLWTFDGQPAESRFISMLDENFEKANDEVRFRFSPVSAQTAGLIQYKDTLMIPKEGYTLSLEEIGSVSNYDSIYFAATARAKDDSEKESIAESGLDNYEVTVTYEDGTTKKSTLKIHGGLNENPETLFIRANASMLGGNKNPSPLCIHYYKLECNSAKNVKAISFKAPANCETEGKIILWAMTGYMSMASEIENEIDALSDNSTVGEMNAILKRIEEYKELGGMETDISNLDKLQRMLKEYEKLKTSEETILDLSTVFNNHIYDYKTAYKHNEYGEDVLGNGMPHDRAASGYWGRNLLWTFDGQPEENRFVSMLDENFEAANTKVRFRFSPVTAETAGLIKYKDTMMIPKEGYTLDLDKIGGSSKYDTVYFAATARAKDDSEKESVAESGLDNYEVTVTYSDDTTEKTTLKIHGGLNENSGSLFLKANASMLGGNKNPSPLCIHYYKLKCNPSKVLKNVSFKAPEGCETEGKIILWAMTGYMSKASKIGNEILTLGDNPTWDELSAILEKIEEYKEAGGQETDIYNYETFKKLLDEYLAIKEQRKLAIAEINDAAEETDEKFMEVCENYADIFDFESAEIAGINKTEMYKALKEYVKVNKFAEEDVEKVWKCYHIYNILAAYSEGVVVCDKEENTELLSELGIDIVTEENFYAIYNALTDEGYKELLKGLENKTYKDTEVFKKVFKEQIVIAAIMNPGKSGTGHIREILSDEVCKEIGIDISDYKNSQYKTEIEAELLNVELKDIEALEDELNLITRDVTKKHSGNGGGSGSGGGGVSVGGGSNAVMPIINAGGDYIKEETAIRVNPFTDIDVTHWVYQAIEELFKRNILNGVSETSFGADAYVTREQLAKIICAMLGSEGLSGDAEFSDVEPGRWSNRYINYCKEKGYVSGYPDGTFAPAGYVTRQDIAVILFRVLGKTEEAGENHQFADSDSISDYAKAAVEYFNQKNIIKGYDDNSFKPKKNCTRGEAASIVYQVLKEMEGDR